MLRDDFVGHPLRKSLRDDPRRASAASRSPRPSHGHGDSLLPDAEARRRTARAAAGVRPVRRGATQPGDPVLHSERLVLNMGPQHPSTHGVLHLYLALEGETVVARRSPPTATCTAASRSCARRASTRRARR